MPGAVPFMTKEDPMHYLTSMGNILAFNTRLLSDGISVKRLQTYCIINVLILGLIYGCSAAYFSRTVMADNGLEAASINLIKIIVAGVPVAFLMHAGAALFVWVFLRAIGGKADFLMSYFHMGVGAIALWCLAPFVAALQIGATAPVIQAVTIVFALYAFSVIVAVTREAFQLSGIKMTIATLVTVSYIGCFLYLWV